MQLPQDYDAGPMLLQEFNDLEADEQTEADRLGYVVTVVKTGQGDQIIAHVTFAEAETDSAEAVATGLNPIVGAAVAAVGAGVGATLGGPLVAAAGAAVATAVTAKLTQNASSSTKQIAAAMQDAADRFDVDPKLLAAIAAVESNFNPTASNPRSTAFGLFQFLNGTWIGVVRQFGATVGVKTTDRADVKAQCLMGAAFTRDNFDFLAKRLARTPTNGDCYAAHFLGAGTAARLLSGPGSTSSATALGARAPSIIAANPEIFEHNNVIRTVAEVTAELTRRVDAAIVRGVGLLESV